MRTLSHQNIGPVDQWLRLSAGFVLLVLAGTGVIGLWGYFGVLPMLTAMFRYCPLYHVLHLHTGGVHRSRA
jgi:hypothetical protein